jgi:hypothetical protein
MKVLSWDVGIINLAYCLIDYVKETNKYKIIDWGVINLTDRDKMKCFQCNANPSYYQESSNKYSCKNHSKLLDVSVPEFDTLFNENENDNCQYNGKSICNKKSKYISTYTDEELYLCNVHCKAKYKSICNQYKLSKYTKKTIASQSMDDFRFRLITELEKRHNLLKCDIVVVENQPSMKNPRMKTISGTVYDYYMIRGMFDKHITQSTITSVRFMSPSNKLKLANNGDTMELVKLKGDDSKTYKLTKQLGIKYCSEMIAQFPEWLTVFNSHKKKDDMADCFLQGMYAAMNT